jgi:hypothetical protein
MNTETTTNTLPVVATETKKNTKKEYPSKTFLNYAEKSGIAVKVSTVKNSGIYPVTFASNGTGIVTSFIYTLATKENGEKVKPDSFIASLNAIEKENFSSPIGKKLSGILPKDYANYKTLRNRLLGDIKRGAILGFVAKENTDIEYSKMKAIIG